MKIFRKILLDIATIVFSPHDPSNIESWSNVFMVQEGFRRLEEYTMLLGVYLLFNLNMKMWINMQNGHENWFSEEMTTFVQTIDK